MILGWAGLAAAALLAAGPAHAHAFESGQDAYALFLQGVAQPWLALPVAVLLVGTGLFLGIWRQEALVPTWPALILGALIGFGLGPLVPEVGGAVLMGAALVVSALGLLALPLAAPLAFGIAAFATALSGRYLMETHALGELPLAFLIGMGVGATTAVALPAGLVQASRERIAHAAVLIGWRALVSWVGAVAILALAFALRPV